MGLVKHLLLWPVTGPLALVDFTMRQVEGMVRRELTDDERVKEDLMALQMRLELGEIDEAEYERAEAEIIERLRETRAWRRRFGMEKEWAPLELTRRSSHDGDDVPPGSDPRA
ncbi:MAG TPA: gas vesicle protein GvpG [Longimicrobiales bacterium]|nr:gas vesicle protein GvpG [Longimicrobiales bacterium]